MEAKAQLAHSTNKTMAIPPTVMVRSKKHTRHPSAAYGHAFSYIETFVN